MDEQIYFIWFAAPVRWLFVYYPIVQSWSPAKTFFLDLHRAGKEPIWGSSTGKISSNFLF